MCNFFARYREPRKLQAAFQFPELPNDPPRYVVRPTDTERVVAIGRDGGRHAVAMRWGLVPYWATDIKVGFTAFNWRSEDVTTTRAFADAWERRRRCLMPCDGFFEFTGEARRKQPWYFRPCDGRVMAFAGLYDRWRGPKAAPLAEPLLSFSIATVAPNDVVAPIHNRMPVLLSDPAQWDAWLNPDTDPDSLQRLLSPAPSDLLTVAPVSRDLLRVKEPTAAILDPISLDA